MQDFSKYKKAKDFLESLLNMPKIEAETDSDKSFLLKRTKLLLKYLKNPEKNFKIIHVTGTAGKGSVCNFLHSQLQNTGTKVGLYTSPHATTTIERIKVNHQLISPCDYTDLVNRLRPILKEVYLKEDLMPSYFDIHLAIALKYFEEQECEYVVLEVGCGGKYDHTNVITPICSVITNVGLDHTKTLGTSKKEIAKVKAGIIKENVPFFTTEKNHKILKIFENTCKEKSAPFSHIKTKNYKLLNSFPYQEFEYENKLFVLKQLGECQIENAILVINILKHLKIPVQKVFNSILPARLEIMEQSPLTIIDSAHNKLKMENLTTILKNFPNKKIHIILALSDTKDKKTLINQLNPYASHFYLTRFTHKWRRTADMKKLQKHTTAPSTIHLEANNALLEAQSNASPDDIIIITGSFFLAGELRTHWYPENEILSTRSTTASLDANYNLMINCSTKSNEPICSLSKTSSKRQWNSLRKKASAHIPQK